MRLPMTGSPPPKHRSHGWLYQPAVASKSSRVLIRFFLLCFACLLACFPYSSQPQVIKPVMPLISQTVSEMSVTALLVFSIFAIGDPNLAIPHALTPACVGTVITLINIGFGGFAIGLNPARDLGPRLIATLTGDGGLFDAGACIYLLSPILGAVLGGYAYTQLASYAQSRRVVRQAAALLRDQGVYGVVVPTPDAMRRSLEQPPSSPAGSQMPQLALA